VNEVIFMLSLNEEEQRMLAGEYGPSVKKAMELLVNVAEANEAKKMIDISQAVISEISEYVISVSEIGRSFAKVLSDMAEDAQFRVPTSVIPLALNLKFAQDIGLPESIIEKEQSVIPERTELYRHLGAIPCYSCVPHFVHDLRRGEHVAFMETNVGMLANSWYGAMTNLEGATTALASAITGKTPEYGLHLPENRHGKVLIEVASDMEPKRFDYADYVALAHWTGQLLFDRIAVYQGLPPSMGPSHAKYMCASQIYNSASGMFHIIGVTPEAATIDAAFGGKAPEEKYIYGKKERKQAYQYFNSATDTKVDMVNIGCPHCTLQELAEIARLIDGRKVNPNVSLLIGVSESVKSLAKRMGFVGKIEDAGGRVVSDMCIRNAALPPLSEILGVKVVASTSGSVAQNVYRRSKGKTTAWFGTTQSCIDAAVTGKWGSKLDER
jgi:predicted aconitase